MTLYTATEFILILLVELLRIGEGAMKTAARRIHPEEAIEKRGALKIGEVSQMSGIGVEALRFYERGGLLGKPSRSTSNYRLYDGSVLERLDFIKKAQKLGFSLDEIKRIISDAEGGLLVKLTTNAAGNFYTATPLPPAA